MKSNSFRKSVGACLLNHHRQLFIAKRISPENAWQMPQGGIDNNEKPQEAIFRELLEEIGTNNVSIISELPPLKYSFPKNLMNNHLYPSYLGQEITWFVMLFQGIDSEINLQYSNHPEFSAWRWEDPRKIIDLTVDFKKDMYLKVIKHLYSTKIIE